MVIFRFWNKAIRRESNILFIVTFAQVGSLSFDVNSCNGANIHLLSILYRFESSNLTKRRGINLLTRSMVLDLRSESNLL